MSNVTNGTSHSDVTVLSPSAQATALALGAAYYSAALLLNGGIVHYERAVADVYRTLITKVSRDDPGAGK